MNKHPDTLAFEKFERDNLDLFSGKAGGIYLRNRLERAFMAGRDYAFGATVRANVADEQDAIEPTHEVIDLMGALRSSLA